MHVLLRRQLQKNGLSADSPPTADQWREFLERVERAYAESEEQRFTLERSLTISSREMSQLYGDLQRSEANFKVLVEGSPDVVFVHREGFICYASPTAARLLGDGTPASVLGRSIDSFVHPDDVAAVEGYGRRRLAGVSQEPLLHRCLTADGSTLYVRTSATQVLFDGAPATLLIARDVTSIQRAEEALRESREHLQQAQKMEAVGRLAGGIAHDFNNILAAILADADWLVSQLGPDHPLTPDAGGIATAAQRAASLTRQLLAFSRRQPWEPKVLALGEVVSDMERLLRRLIGEDVKLTYEHEGGACQVQADRSQIEQVLLNLVVNARDAMPHGGLIAVRTRHADFEQPRDGVPPGHYAVLEVADTGCGMDQDTLARAFEPFFTTKEAGHGTGLGLSTVFGIVRQSGGWIVCKSEVGFGTTFQILLPAHQPRMPSIAPPRRESVRPVEGRILVVEDDSEVRRVVCRVLRSSGYEVIEAESGARALEALDALPELRLVISDVVMPGLDGVALQETVRARRPDTPVLLMSGYTDQIARLQSTSLFVHKPFTPEQLRQSVRRALAQVERCG